MGEEGEARWHPAGREVAGWEATVAQLIVYACKEAKDLDLVPSVKTNSNHQIKTSRENPTCRKYTSSEINNKQ